MARDRLEVAIKNITLKTPLMTASGTSGSANELERLAGSEAILQSLGAFVTKGVSLKPRPGNPEIRVIETRGGLLNSIGLQNKGAEAFVAEDLPCLLRYQLPIFVNISADSVEGFGELAGYLSENDINELISGIEINVSCPNIKEGGMAFGVNPRLVERVVRAVKKNAAGRMAIITKLTPNVTDVTESARGAIHGGTDALSMINTLRGMAVDVDKKIPSLGNVAGGLSGPAIKPVGLFAVYECFRKIPECREKKVPIIGIGGVASGRDALEYIMAGATAIGIGTAWFVNSGVFREVRREIVRYLIKEDTTINKLVGILHRSEA